MNAVMERWIGGCRRELLERSLIWNLPHLRRILREYETHHNSHRPHMALARAAPDKPLPPEVVDLDASAPESSTGPAVSSASIVEWLDLQGRDFRQGQSGYAPELDPVEQCWAWIKNGPLANYCATTLAEMTGAAARALEQLRQRPEMLTPFLRHTGLDWK